MKGRRKRVQRNDGSVYRRKGKKPRREARSMGRTRVRKPSRDWTRHKVWRKADKKKGYEKKVIVE
jgi:hypothetical protein